MKSKRHKGAKGDRKDIPSLQSHSPKARSLVGDYNTYDPFNEAKDEHSCSCEETATIDCPMHDLWALDALLYRSKK